MDILQDVVEVKISELETTEMQDDNTADEIITDISEMEEIKIDALAGVDDTNNKHVDALAGIQDHTGENSNMKGIGITNNNKIDVIWFSSKWSQIRNLYLNSDLIGIKHREDKSEIVTTIKKLRK